MADDAFWADWSGWGTIPGTTGNLDPSSSAKPAGTAGAGIGTGTGQHGFVPIFGRGGDGQSLGGGMGAAISEFKAWLDQPFTSNMSPMSVFILIGVIAVSILAWNFILYHVRIAAESI